MPSVAEQLRQARESMHLDIQQVAEATKLKTDHVRALEQGNFDAFTAPVYLRGSLRTYAKMLKLDANKLVEQLDAELGAGESGRAGDSISQTKKKTPLDSIMLLVSQMNWVAVVAIAVIAVLGLIGYSSYRAWQRHKTADPYKNLGSGMYQPPIDQGETLPLPTNVVRRSNP